MRRSDLFVLAAILCVAAGLRIWAPWHAVFGDARVNFLETDAWYHVRIVENQVRNFPRHLTFDPYASPNGQYVAVAPLFDTVIATIVFATRGPSASTAYIERVAALTPAVMGVLAVLAIWFVATVAFDRRAGLLAAAAAAILPGHFLDRTEIGFVDHHALEVVLSIATLGALARALAPAFRQASVPVHGPDSRQAPDRSAPAPRPASLAAALVAGVLLGLYLLAWSSGAYFVAILTLWVVAMPLVAEAPVIITGARAASVTAAVALVIVVGFQDPNLFRYNTQVASLSAMLMVSLLMMMLAGRILIALGMLVLAAIVAVAAATIVAPDLARQVGIDLARFQPDATRMAVLEARPLFLYPGNWRWLQPWLFFGTGFYAGLVATVALTLRLRRSQRLDHLLIVVFVVANYLATIGQNRFGYYLVPATALVIGWMCARILDWGAGGVAEGNGWRYRRELAGVAVALVILPNLWFAATKSTRSVGMADYWAQAIAWLRTSTPEPFASPDYYFARYTANDTRPQYTVMNWWDQGYWLIQMAHRVPVSNPTQNGAPVSAAFLTSTDEDAAMRILESERARYVIVDWELPFRETEGGSLAGRFQNLADWAGLPTSRFYSVCFQRRSEVDEWTPIWVFREAYYQSMAYRLMVLGGNAVTASNNVYVIQLRDRRDANGRGFCEAGPARQYVTVDEARTAAAARGPEFHVVGLTPWQPAFPVAAITSLRQVQDFRSPTQQANEAPMVRVFEVSRP